MNKIQLLLSLTALLSVSAFGCRCFADSSEIVGRNGSVFMEEDTAGNKAQQLPEAVSGASNATPATAPAAPGQEIVGENGNVFMEEAHPVRRAAPAPPARRPVRIITHNYENVGVPTDPNGNIIPLIDRTGPSVRPLSSTLDTYNEYAPAPVPSFAPGQLINIAGYAQPVMPFNAYGYPPVGYPGASFSIGGLNIGLGPRVMSAPIIPPMIAPGGMAQPFAPTLFGSPFASRSYTGTSFFAPLLNNGSSVSNSYSY